MKVILYIGNFSFPLGNAAGKRVYANGKILKELGYKVIFVGQDNQMNNCKNLKDTEKLYDGFYHYAFSYPKTNVEWMKYRKAFNLLLEFIKQDNLIKNLKYVIIYGSPRFSLFNKLLINYFRKNNVKIITDSVDWLSTKTNNPIFNLVKTFHYNFQNKYINKKANGVITISKYLESYYKNNGLKTIVLPPLSPSYQARVEVHESKRVIVYAGIPFRIGKIIKDLNTLKDRIDKIILFLFMAKEKGVDFRFDIYGFTKSEYLSTLPSQQEYVDGLGKSIVFHGLKSNEEVTRAISKADFTILVRDISRDTTAGFPTKVSESISCGTPVITNKTSDLEEYIVDGKNGYFIDADNYGKAVETILNALFQNKEEIINMKKNCTESGIFYYKNYIDRLKQFIESL